jgi:hypothetical protein
LPNGTILSDSFYTPQAVHQRSVPEITFLVQPESQIGDRIAHLLAAPQLSRVILVSAWANRHTLLRLEPTILRARTAGIPVRVVVGIDLGGTSKEALQEIRAWDVDSYVIKNRRGGSTFHPKLYVVERTGRSDILIGSSNLTEGGFFTNYESVVQITYELPRENDSYQAALTQLSRFLQPTGETSRRLTDDLLRTLVNRGDIPTESEIRRRQRAESRQRRAVAGGQESPFGAEAVTSPPSLPPDVLRELLQAAEADRRRLAARPAARRPNRTAVPPSRIEPNSFYMTLPRMRGPSIPGEARIPLAARDVAPDFWGWPDEYTRLVSPRGGEAREYLNWKPIWRVRTADDALDGGRLGEVRMYEYTNSSDFRFYSKRLLDMGADEGDIVRITRIAEPDAEFECVLARRGTTAYTDWLRHCTQQVRNSDRRYGYA